MSKVFLNTGDIIIASLELGPLFTSMRREGILQSIPTGKIGTLELVCTTSVALELAWESYSNVTPSETWLTTVARQFWTSLRGLMRWKRG